MRTITIVLKNVGDDNKRITITVQGEMITGNGGMYPVFGDLAGTYYYIPSDNILYIKYGTVLP